MKKLKELANFFVGLAAMYFAVHALVFISGCAAPVIDRSVPLVPEQEEGFIHVNWSIHNTNGMVFPDSLPTCGCTHYEIYYDMGQGDVAWGPVNILSLAIFNKIPLPEPTYPTIYFDSEQMFYWMAAGGYFIENIIVKCYRKRVDL